MKASSLRIETERLLLRPLQPSDAPTLHNLVNDWAVVRNLAQLPFPYPRELADEWIASTIERNAATTGINLAITGPEAGSEFIGCIGLRLDPVARTGTLGYWIGRRYWGHGVATEAATRFARWALANLDLDHLEASVIADNPASAAVLRRAGFRDTGTGEAGFLARGGKHPVLHFEARRDDLSPPAFTNAVTSALTNTLSGTPPNAPTAAPPGAKPIILVAACALIDVDGRILLTRRPEGKAMAGLWEFPGGKLEPGETPEAALIRELHEELGIDVAESCLAPFAFASHAYDKFHLLMPLYLCRRWSGRPEGRENQTLAWVPPRRLTEYPMPPADKPLIPLLRDFL